MQYRYLKKRMTFNATSAYAGISMLSPCLLVVLNSSGCDRAKLNLLTGVCRAEAKLVGLRGLRGLRGLFEACGDVGVV